MNKKATICCALLAFMNAALAYASSGESWEIAATTEMPGISAAMGESTVTVCLPKGAEKDPRQFTQQAGECEITELKSSGNKTTWKMRCDKEGNVMLGNGEVTYKADRFQGITKLSGTSDGKPVKMTSQFQGKRVGVPCDPSAEPVVAIKGMESVNELMGLANKQMASAMAEQCEVSNYRAVDLVSNRFFGPTAACPGKEKFACKVINKNVQKNVDVFIKLAKHDDTSDFSITKACSIDMEATTRLICKMVDSNNFEELSEYCPVEAKAFESERGAAASPKSGAAASDSTVNSVIDGARKLKGLFGF